MMRFSPFYSMQAEARQTDVRADGKLAKRHLS